MRGCRAYCTRWPKVTKVTNPISDFTFLSTAKSRKSRIQNPFLDSPKGTHPYLDESPRLEQTFSPPQRLPLGIPIKISIIEKIESAREYKEASAEERGTNRKRQGTSAIHMSHVYQNCQRAKGLAWTAWMKIQNIVAINISFLKTHRDSRILHSRTAKKTCQIMWRKGIFKWQPSKLLWIWIFGAAIKVRTTEKNYRYYLGRLLWSCLKPQAGFAEREKKLYCRLDCSSEWLHSLYL